MKRELLPLLACWSDIGTHGDNALYRQTCLNPTVLKQDPVFADNGYGEFLQDNSQTLLTIDSQKAMVGGSITINDVLITVINGVAIPYPVVAGDTTVTILATHIVSAINATTKADPITGLPLNQVIGASNASGVITIKAVNPGSFIHAGVFTLIWCDGDLRDTRPRIRVAHSVHISRAGNSPSSPTRSGSMRRRIEPHEHKRELPPRLAGAELKLSVRELLLLIQVTGLDPFAAPGPDQARNPAADLPGAGLRDRSLKSYRRVYLIWNQDLSGKSGTTPEQVRRGPDAAARLRRGGVRVRRCRRSRRYDRSVTVRQGLRGRCRILLPRPAQRHADGGRRVR